MKNKRTKFNKESRNLLIAMLLGDGTLCKPKTGSVNMKIHQGRFQKEYTEWKARQLDLAGIPNSGVCEYFIKTNFTHGEKWPTYVCRIYTNPFLDVLRRVIYKPEGKIFSRKLLNRLDARGLAIWYMDDGSLNFKKHKRVDGTHKVHGLFLRISTCLPKAILQTYIDYFKEVWDIHFYMYHEGKKEDSYSLNCGTNEAIKFMNIVKPYVSQIPRMRYKIEYDLSNRKRLPIISTPIEEETGDIRKNEDIVRSHMKV